jgi:hypothetical protein
LLLGRFLREVQRHVRPTGEASPADNRISPARRDLPSRFTRGARSSRRSGGSESAWDCRRARTRPSPSLTRGKEDQKEDIEDYFFRRGSPRYQ